MLKLRDILGQSIPMACIVQGGGMRGTYSIAALSELERLGYAERFEAIYGSSAGALNAAYFMSFQGGEGVSIYVDYLSTNKFIDMSRIRPVIDIDYLIDDVLCQIVPLKKDLVKKSKTDLYIYATDANTGKIRRFSNREDPLMEFFRATAALPIVYGKEIQIQNSKYVDGGLISTVPLEEAIMDGWKNILLILTRPISYRSSAPSYFMKMLIKSAGVFVGHSRPVVKLLGKADDSINKCMNLIQNDEKKYDINIWVIAPTNEKKLVSRLNNTKEMLTETARMAKEDVHYYLEREGLMR